MLDVERISADASASLLDRTARRLVLGALGRFPRGQLTLREPDGNEVVLGRGEPCAALRMNDWRTYRMMMTGGALGAAEAFMEDLWSSDDLVAVVRYFAANVEPMQALEGLASKMSKPLLSALHVINRNSVRGSRRNIAAHYDLGNDFFSLFLDKQMMYSSAIYPRADAPLDEAAVHKLDIVCQKLQLNDQHHLLEIGTGWGGLAIHAARHYGCRVTTTTISQEQFRHAQARVRAEGLEDRITVLEQDYRLLEGRYDRVVSIEMIEAVGHQYLSQYFRQLNRLLAEDGMMLLQAITVPDHRYRFALKNIDFIKRYIFPGGFLPSVRVMMDHLGEDTQLTPLAIDDIGLDYARTLADWRERFTAALDQVAEQGFDQRFQRMWQYYLCYCEGAFRERAISTVQVLAAGRGWRPAI
ncbi:MAG: cyclopropane-fatty-acyl-phospholipid synthase [Alcanivoracaceae bacterium]|nr:cyclopropane-fatty-acyl-phospholipid synthase [Alcanivoracaceae bacterium]